MSVRRKLLGLLQRHRRPRRTPTVLQMEAVECGAAALGIILGYHGRWIPLEELRLACGVSRDGSKASNIVKAARRYGLIAQGRRRDPEGLRAFDAPVILHWNFNHFLVLEGIRSDRVFLNDPAVGPKEVTWEELDHAFTGILLEFEPGEEFEQGGERPSLLPSLRRRLAGSHLALAFVILAGLALVVPGLAAPVFAKIFVDEILLDARTEWLPALLLAMLFAALLTASLTWIQQTYLLRLETRMALVGSARFLWHVLRLPVEFFSQRFAGDISSRVTINDRVAQLLSRDLATHFLGAIMAVFFVVVLFQYDAVLTLVGIGTVSLNILALRYVSRKRIDGSRRLQQEQGKLNGTAIGGLKGIETLKATGGESDLFGRWAGYQAKVVNIRQDLERYTQMLEAVPPMLSAVNTALILGVGSLRVIQGGMTLGGLVAFQVLMASFVAPVSRLVSLGGTLQTARGDMERLDDVLGYPLDTTVCNEETEEADPSGVGDIVRLSGRLELHGVTFGYSPLDPPLIRGFSLVVEPGSRIALVGGSGSGKSTVARLISGLYRPWEGEILFDGFRREDLPSRVLHDSMAVVDQTISLFAGTVRENLTLWDSTVPLPDVIAAARDAAIHDKIASRPQGYDSPIAESGSNWSGGEQQRLEIARALVGNPSLIILDEATSALDPATEQTIDEQLRRRGCTTLIIAHRLSTIRDADQILVLDRGEIVEQGGHETLLAAGGLYAGLVSHE